MSYDIEPTRNGQPALPADYEMMAQQQFARQQAAYDLGDQLYSEQQYRSRNGFYGAWDMLLSVKGSVILATLGETLQTEREGYLAQEVELKAQFPDMDVSNMIPVDLHSHDPFMLLASIPLDAKAAAVGVAAFGLASAARRVRRMERFPEDARNAVRQVAEADEFIPYDKRGTRMFRLRRRLADAALTATAVTASYQAAKHGTQMEDLAAVGGLSLLAIGSVYAAQFRNWRQNRRFNSNFRNQGTGFGSGNTRLTQ